MQLPHVNASSEVYLDYTDHFEGAAEAWQDAEILKQTQLDSIAGALTLVSDSAAALRKAAGTNDAAARAATKARARYRVRDVILDLRIMAASDALLNGLCGRDRTHPKYRFVFSDATAGEITDAKIREEPEIAGAMLDRYTSIEDFPGKSAAGDQLADAVQKSVDTRTVVDLAEKAENSAGGDELLARLGARNALEQAYGVLITAFPGQRAFVESFFLKREQSATKAAAKAGGAASGGSGGTAAGGSAGGGATP